MKPVRVLYVGALSGTSLQRAEAMRRLGYRVAHFAPTIDLPKHWGHWLNRAGGLGIDTLVAQSLRRQIGAARYDVALVDSGDVVGPAALATVRAASPVVGNYNLDNPYRDPPTERRRWSILRRACREYDLLVTPKRPHASDDVRRVAGKEAMQVWLCADELVHRPIELTKEQQPTWASEVVFVGTWMPGRDNFLARLIAQGVQVSIYGPRWHKAPAYRVIAPHLKGDYLEGAQYSLAIRASKVALVMLNGANDDLHTTRSSEIPAIGTVMCAPRTAHHLELYKEGREAAFFGDADECVAKCKVLLADRKLREGIAAAGHQRTFTNQTYNEPLMRGIIEALINIGNERPI